MATNSSIEWTDTTWNPLAGCTRASSGCDNCYAAVMSLRLEAMALADIEAGKDPGAKRKYIGVATKTGHGVSAFNGTINLDEDELQRPYSWKKPRRVFVNSMSDLFHKDVPEWFILSVFNVMRDNPQHVFQVLTKRPDRAANFTNRLPSVPRNVWMGTSVENQKTADLRIPELLKVPATVRFLSMEPLLGPVDLSSYLANNCLFKAQKHTEIAHGAKLRREQKWHGEIDRDGNYTAVCEECGQEFDDGVDVHWVIVGGESGPNARAFDLSWAYSIVNQCQGANVPVFVKQFGTNPTSVPCGYEIKDKKGGNWHEWPEDLRLRELPNA